MSTPSVWKLLLITFIVWEKGRPPSGNPSSWFVGINHLRGGSNLTQMVLLWVTQERHGGGGLIRDSYGKWIKGYMRHIGISTSIIAEFWALRDGLMWILSFQAKHLITHTHLSSTIAGTYCSSSSKLWSGMCLGRPIEERTALLKELLANFWFCCFWFSPFPWSECYCRCWC